MRILTRVVEMSLVVIALAASISAAAQANWDVTKTMHIGGAGAWDYVTVDNDSHRLFITRSTHTQIIDDQTGNVLGDIPGQKRSHGVTLVPALNRGFITDGGGDGAIVVFDLKTYAILGTLATMPDSDGIIYDRLLDLVLAVSGDKGMLMIFKPDIDPAKGKIDPPIDLGGSPEFLQYDDAGKAYVAMADKDVIDVVDLKARKVIARWPVAPGGRPVGLSIDRKSHRLFIGCRNPQKLIVMSTVDGKVIADLPIGAGVDAVKNHAGLVFASAGDGTLTVIGEKAGKFEVEQTVKTPLGARTMGIDESTFTVFLPTAEFLPAAPGAASRRPTPKPDSFMIVAVGQTR
jgi:DNA-binding beta-propeller fold protein YncE